MAIGNLDVPSTIIAVSTFVGASWAAINQWQSRKDTRKIEAAKEAYKEKELQRVEDRSALSDQRDLNERLRREIDRQTRDYTAELSRVREEAERRITREREEADRKVALVQRACELSTSRMHADLMTAATALRGHAEEVASAEEAAQRGMLHVEIEHRNDTGD